MVFDFEPKWRNLGKSLEMSYNVKLDIPLLEIARTPLRIKGVLLIIMPKKLG